MTLLSDLKSDMSEDIAVFSLTPKELHTFVSLRYPFIYRFLTYFAKEAVYFYKQEEVNYFALRDSNGSYTRLRIQLHKDFLLEFEAKYSKAITKYLEECKKYLLEYGNDGYSHVIRSDIYKKQDLTNYCADYFKYNWLEDKNYFVDRFKVIEKGKEVDITAKHWIANNKALTMDFSKAGKITFPQINMLKKAVEQGRGMKTLLPEEQCMVEDGKWNFGFNYPEWIYTGGNLRTALPLYICHSFLKKFYLLTKALILSYQNELEARCLSAQESHIALTKLKPTTSVPKFLLDHQKLRLQNRKEIVLLSTYKPLTPKHGNLSYSKVNCFTKDQHNLIDKLYDEMAREDVADISTNAKFEEEFSKLDPALQLMVNLSAMTQKTDLENGIQEWLKILKKNPKLYDLVQSNILLEYDKQANQNTQNLDLCMTNMQKIDKYNNALIKKEEKTLASYDKKFKKVLQDDKDIEIEINNAAIKKKKALDYTLKNAPQKLLHNALLGATQLCELAGIELQDNNEIMQVAKNSAKMELYYKQVDAQLTLIHMNLKNLKEQKQQAEKTKIERIKQCDKMTQTLYMKAFEQYSVGEEAGKNVTTMIAKVIESKNASDKPADKEMLDVLTKLYEYFNTKKVGKGYQDESGLIVAEVGRQNGENFYTKSVATNDFMSNLQIINGTLQKLFIDPIKQEIEAINEQIKTEEEDIARIQKDIQLKTKLQTTHSGMMLMELRGLQEIKANRLKNDLQKQKLEKGHIEKNGLNDMKIINAPEAQIIIDNDFDNEIIQDV
jgi:hypothetical protein